MGSPSFPALADNLEETWMLVPLPTLRSRPEKLDNAFLWPTSRHGNSSTTSSATLTYVAWATQHDRSDTTHSQMSITSALQIALSWTLSLRYLILGCFIVQILCLFSPSIPWRYCFSGPHSYSASSSLPPFPVMPPQMPLPREPTPLPTQIVSLAFCTSCSLPSELTDTANGRANAAHQVALAEFADSVTNTACHITCCIADSLRDTSESFTRTTSTSRESASHAVTHAFDGASYSLASP
jgi:hypothetical protein